MRKVAKYEQLHNKSPGQKISMHIYILSSGKSYLGRRCCGNKDANEWLALAINMTMTEDANIIKKLFKQEQISQVTTGIYLRSAWSEYTVL